MKKYYVTGICSVLLALCSSSILAENVKTPSFIHNGSGQVITVKYQVCNDLWGDCDADATAQFGKDNSLSIAFRSDPRNSSFVQVKSVTTQDGTTKNFNNCFVNSGGNIISIVHVNEVPGFVCQILNG